MALWTKLISILAAFINWSTKYKKETSITRVYTCYSEILNKMSEEIWLQLWNTEYLNTLE